MALARTEVLTGMAGELSSFETLMRSLNETEWTAPTRCAGWAVSDVCAHVVGTISDIANGRLDELVAAPGGPSPSDRQVAERRGRTRDHVADELRDTAKIVADIGASFDDAAWAGPPPIDVGGTLGGAVEGIWYDTYVHAEDVRSAIGRSSERGAGLAAAVSHVADLLTQRAWGPATLRLEGLQPFAVSGGGREVSGDPLAFLLAATGRADAAMVGLDASVNVYGS